MKFRRIKSNNIVGKNVNTVFKAWQGTPNELRQLRNPRLRLPKSDKCCTDWAKNRSKKGRYLVMGKKDHSKGLTATFILPWNRRSKNIKKARRMFKKIDCNNLAQTTQQMMDEALANHSSSVFSQNQSSPLPIDKKLSKKHRRSRNSRGGRGIRHSGRKKNRNQQPNGIFSKDHQLMERQV